MPAYPHRIRLRGPWECEPIDRWNEGPLPAPRRVTVPGRLPDFGLAGFEGQVSLLRKFGYPGQIDEDERVWLVCDGFEGTASVFVNGVILTDSAMAAFAFNITKLLRPHNRLELLMFATCDQEGPFGEVALEIRATAYLRAMKAAVGADGSIEVSGTVAGACDGPLELYLMLDGAQVHYERIEAASEGRPFHRRIDPPAKRPKQVRVELVNISTVWYAWEQSF